MQKISDYASPAVTNFSGEAMEFSIHTSGYVINLDDGTSFGFVYSLDNREPNENSSFDGSIGVITFDINNFKTGPNVMGKDIFAFYLDDSGALVPVGGNDAYLFIEYCIDGGFMQPL